MKSVFAVAVAFSMLSSIGAFAQASQPAATFPDQPVDPNDKVRCKRIPITGSLVKAEKVCKTVAEWRRLSERGNDLVRDLADTSRVCSGGDVICRGN